jgi:transposase-like protein/IS1 family transposase
MIAISCQHDKSHKHGKDRQGNQRFKCALCGATFVEPVAKPLGSLRITMKEATTILGMLLEGMSVRAAERLTGICRQTICDLILIVGENCQQFLETTIRNLPTDDVQVDEIWGFIGCKEKNRTKRNQNAEWGDSWTFLGIDRESKMILAHQVGQRDHDTCVTFLRRLNKATTGRFQISTDGLGTYTHNVPFELGGRVDFAQLVKTYSSTQEQTRYSPATIISAEKKPVFGNPDWSRVCTSHIERFNLTVRMHNRRFTRLTNAHSKSPKHHAAMQSIFVAWYNFCRKHETLKGQTPAMAAGLADKAWTIREMLEKSA